MATQYTPLLWMMLGVLILAWVYLYCERGGE